MRAGFIGLGTMGWPMAGHLRARGYLQAVWSHTGDKAHRFADEHGVIACAEPAALWAQVDAIVVCVRADAEMMTVIEALAVPAARGKLVIDASTVADHTAREAAARMATVGARFIDAPVTGGAEGARGAALTFMVGGADADVAAAMPLLEAMGARQVHLGAVGAGQACKAVNQVMAAGINQAVCEGLALAEASGLDATQVVDVVGSGAAGSWFVQHRGHTMLAGDYPPGFRMALHHKDLRICQDMAAGLGLPLPTVDRTVADYEILMAEGFGDDDISGLYRRHRGRRQPVAQHASAPAEYWFEEGCWISEWWNKDVDPEVSVARARVPAGSTTRLHRLAGIVERYVVLAGRGTARIDGQDYALKPNDTLVIASDAAQQVSADAGADLVFLAICTPRFRPSAYRDAATAK